MTLPARYHAPAAEQIFTEQEKIFRWTNLTKAFMLEAIDHDSALNDEERRELYALVRAQVKQPSVVAVRTREQDYRHDVVAFLSLIEQYLNPEIVKYLHLGLTSSDLVENVHFAQLRHHAERMSNKAGQLRIALARWENMCTLRAGRSHGQIADLTSWSHQMHTFSVPLTELGHDFDRYHQRHILKSPGPTGKVPTDPFRGYVVASRMGAAVIPSTQVIPRDYQIRWAALYLRLACICENLALLVRAGARSEVAEVWEGTRRTGSSAMPHKRNPVESEKVCGLARVARGYFATIAEGGALWDDRDISNSSLERIAVPDLAAVTEYMVDTITDVIDNLVLDFKRMHDNASDPRTMSNMMQTTMQLHFNIGPVRASTLIREWVTYEPFDVDLHGLADRLGVGVEAVRTWFRGTEAMWERILDNEPRPEGEDV